MKLRRFLLPESHDPDAKPCAKAHVALEADGQLLDLTTAGCPSLLSILESADPVAAVGQWQESAPVLKPDESRVRWLPPLEDQEIWAAGVTYERSKKARMEESTHSATAYDRVYEADRPEIFFKAAPGRAVGTGAAIGVRKDSHWTVPEPELVLVFNSRGQVAAVTLGDDVSARDIEGENLLYLPQAKIYDRSCAIGPALVIGADESEVRSWTISLEIERDGASVFQGSTPVARLRRTFTELGAYLFRSQTFPNGAALFTGTGIVPPDAFSLRPGDTVRISLTGVGTLENTVITV